MASSQVFLKDMKCKSTRLWRLCNVRQFEFAKCVRYFHQRLDCLWLPSGGLIDKLFCDRLDLCDRSTLAIFYNGNPLPELLLKHGS